MGDILVVSRENLFAGRYFQGFISSDDNNYIESILKNFEYRERNEELENNPEFQQIIPYVWIINTVLKKVFAYRRASGKERKERRLVNKWSCGVGGHIDRDTEEGAKDPIFQAMMREMKEEVIMTKYPKPRVIGFLNDDSDSVGKVHFGVVAVAETTENVLKGSQEMAEGNFYSIDEVEKLFTNPDNDIEKWTRISWPFVKDYLSKL